MAISFDDLIPQSPAGGLSFEDLVPASDANLANPFNRIQTPGQPTTSIGAPPSPQADISGEFRAAAGGPLMDRGAAALQTYLPPALGGTGQGYSSNLAQNRADTAAAQTAHPADAFAGNIAGAFPYALAPGGILGAAGAGAVAGAAGSPDWSNPLAVGKNALASALMGGGVGTVAKGLGAGFNALRGPAEEAAPTLADIGAQKTAAYAGVKDMNAAYTPQSYADMAQGILQDAKDDSISAARHPKAYSAITDLTSSANDALDNDTPVTLTQLDQQRQVIRRDVMSSPDASERYFGSKAIAGIDNLINTAGPDQMVAGAGPDAAAAIQNARDLAQRQFKANELQDQLNHARLMAGKSGIGGNQDNWARTAMQRALESGQNWTPEETVQLTQGVMGGTGQNVLRGVGRLSPTAGALPIMGELGAGAVAAAKGHGLGLASTLPVVGYGAKVFADRASQANARNALDTILRGGTAAPPTAGVNLSPYSNALAAALAGRQ